MVAKTYNTLFLCTGNSARSIMAEALLNQFGRERFRAYSAGSHPAGSVNPMVLELLERQGLATKDLRSKNWDEFVREGAPQMDFVFTLCDRAAGEQCPAWLGSPITAHWGFEDPVTASHADRTRLFHYEKVFHEISARIRLFLALPLEKIDRMSLQRELRRMGGREAAS